MLAPTRMLFSNDTCIPYAYFCLSYAYESNYVEQENKQESPVVIGYVNFGPSLYTRSHDNPALYDGNIVLRPEFRGRRWIGDLTEIRVGIGVDCGVRCFFEESYTSNVPATRSLRRTGATVCGTVARNTYVRDVGFVDGVLFYKPLDSSHSFRLANTTVIQSKI